MSGAALALRAAEPSTGSWRPQAHNVALQAIVPELLEFFVAA